MFKYLFFMSVPLIGFMSINTSGVLTYSLLFYAFGVVPVIELLLQPDHSNLSKSRIKTYQNNGWFDFLIYLVLPLYCALLIFFLIRISEINISSSTSSLIGIVVSFGLLCGIMAINVGHELGHRHTRWQRLIGEVLLVLALQAHFLPYHNHGHHRFVGTPNDPATARRNESIYHFWIRSQVGSFIAAWRIEWQRLSSKKRNPLGSENRMLWYSFAEVVLLITIWTLVGGIALIGFLFACLIGALLLETVNYIEHYGLVRKSIGDDRYERVTPMHSWNSDHLLGRLMLFELSRHSDHHANPTKPYQLLESYVDSPQMPTGYPGMMILSLFPPLWFRVMNRRLSNN